MRKLLFFAFTTLLICGVKPSFSQDGEKKVIQFSGVVVNKDSTMGIPGVHVYVPGKRRGTSANPYGYFSFPLLAGDTVAFSAVGFRKKYFRVPFTEKDSHNMIVYLEEDTTMLDELEILPYPTEEMFKEAVLAMRLPNSEDLNNMDRNLDPYILTNMYTNMPMDGSMNHRYFTMQQAEYLHDAYGVRSNPLMNPFAWAQFFKSLKKKK